MNLLLAPEMLTLIGGIIDKVFPDKQAAAKAKQEFMAKAADMEQQQVKEFHDFVIKYEGSGDNAPALLQVLRGSVRPVLTYTLAGLYGWGFLHPAEFTAEQMQGLFQLNIISLGFWYGEKALSRLGLNLNKNK